MKDKLADPIYSESMDTGIASLIIICHKIFIQQHIV